MSSVRRGVVSPGDRGWGESTARHSDEPVATPVRQVSVTVVIPAYNEEANVGRLVRQVLAEQWTEPLALDQVIVVDDCSEDNTRAIAEGLAHTYAHVRVIRHAERLGKNAAIRTAVAACTSAIVAFIDADVRLGPQCLTRTILLLVSNSSLMAASCLFESMPVRSWRERASRFQLLYVTEMGRLGYGALQRLYIVRASTLSAFRLPDETADDMFITRWLNNHGYCFGLRTDATAYIRCAAGLRDFAKQTVRGWRTGEALERTLPPTSTAMPLGGAPLARRKKALRRALLYAMWREPLGFALYLIYRAIIRVTPTEVWLPILDHSRHDSSLSTKDLGA